MLRKFKLPSLQLAFSRVWKSKCRPLEYHESWPLVFFEPDIAKDILPQAVRHGLAQNIVPYSMKPRAGDMVGQARRLKQQIESGSPCCIDLQVVSAIRLAIMTENDHERGTKAYDSFVNYSSDFLTQVSDELAVREGRRRSCDGLACEVQNNKWLVDENLHGLEQVPGSYMGRGPAFLMEAAWGDFRAQRINREAWLHQQADKARLLPPLEMAAELKRLLSEHHNAMTQQYRDAVTHRSNVTIEDLFDTQLFENMAGLNDRDVLKLSIGRGCAVVVSKDRNPGQDDDGLCRLHLNRALEVMDLLERIDMGPNSSMYPYVLHTMPMIVLPIVPEVKGNLRMAETLVLQHADEIGRLAESRSVPLVKVSPEGGVEAFGNYRQLRNWQGQRSAAQYKDSDELIARLGHFANGDKFFRRSKFQHLAPVGQTLGLV